MSAKHIFIGIGGAGVSTVSLIKQKVYERYQENGSKTRADQMNEKYRFLFIDTDPRDVNKANEKNREIYEGGRVPFINPQTELVSLAQGNAHAIYEEAKQFPTSMVNQRILEACTEELAAMIPDQPLALGAGAFRMKSRISFARSMSEFQQKLQAHIEDLNSVKLTGGDDTRIMYWLVSSGIGGTGSGIVNDVLYYINMQHQRSIGDGDPHLVFTMYMPKFYIDKNSTEEKYSANAFALMSEIEAIKAMSMDPKRNTLYHRLAFIKDYNLINSQQRYDPFYYMIPIDCQTDKGANIGSAMYSNTAEMLFYIHEGNGGDALHSDVDNYMHDLYFQRPKGFLVPMGYIALRKPEAEFTQYVEARIKRDVLMYGLRNETAPKVDDKDRSASSPIVKLYKEAFNTTLAKELARKKDEIIEDAFTEGKIHKNGETSNEVLLTDEELVKVGVDTSLVINTIDEITHIPELKDKLKAAKNEIKSLFWLRADEMIRENGSQYTADFYKKLTDYAKEQFTKLNNAERPDSTEEIAKAHEEVVNFTVGEKMNKDSQRGDVKKYYATLRSAAEVGMDYEIQKIMHQVYADICNQDGDGILKELADYLDSLNKIITEKANEASKEYRKLANKMGEKAQDVTSVYLPDLKNICDANGWFKNNYFSKMYEKVLKASSIAVEGDDNMPVRNGEESLVSFFDAVYSPNSKYNKEIKKKGYEIGGKTRILANEVKAYSSGGTASVEDFVYYVQHELLEAIKSSGEVQSLWYNRSIASFFEELESKEKDRVRQSLMPSLFFNYKGNRIAVDYREFLIFVAADEDLATRMLGYQDGNPNHRFIGDKSASSSTALVIRAKYGLSFSDYRIYDNLKAIYDKAPFRDKYHFHHSFAEYGEDLTIDDLPYEVSPAHRVFAKLLLLQKFQKDIDDFFYTCSDFQSRKNDYAKFMLVSNTPETFSIARPKALSEREGKLCLTMVDRNTNLYADFEGESFAESFALYQKSFVRNAIQETYRNFLHAIEKYNVNVQTPEGPSIISGADIIKDKFKTYRDELLREFDEKIFSAESAAEKALYRIFFSVIETEVTNVRSL